MIEISIGSQSVDLVRILVIEISIDSLGADLRSDYDDREFYR